MVSIYNYLNHFARIKKHNIQNKEYIGGYEQACRDIFEDLSSAKINLKIRINDIDMGEIQ